MQYATPLSGNAAATYRQIDVVGRSATASPAELIQLLYEELVAALRAAGWAAEHRKYAIKSDRITRATAILFALEAGLDFEKGGEVAMTLARLYAGARNTIIAASLGHDPAPFRSTANDLDEIAKAWRSISG
jgi:flagellar protein FliS